MLGTKAEKQNTLHTLTSPPPYLNFASSMSRAISGVSLLFCFWFLCPFQAVSAGQEEDILPPFGLRWGETPEHLESLLRGAKATIVDKSNAENREVWTVEGIVQTGLRRTLFYLQKDQLVQVELQYESPQWDTQKYESFMASIRQRLDTKYGSGELLVRSKAPQEKVTQTLVGYKWAKPRSSIKLIYFAAEKGDQIFRTVSIHYRAF